MYFLNYLFLVAINSVLLCIYIPSCFFAFENYLGPKFLLRLLERQRRFETIRGRLPTEVTSEFQKENLEDGLVLECNHRILARSFGMLQGSILDS